MDPSSKMPKTSYERRKHFTEQNSIESSSTCSIAPPNIEAEKLKNFYRSIPDYNEINHLPADQFYSTLKSLREKKKVVLGLAIERIDTNGDIDKTLELFVKTDNIGPCSAMNKPKFRRKLSDERKETLDKNVTNKCSDFFIPKNSNGKKHAPRKTITSDVVKNTNELKVTSLKSNLEKSDRPKRNHSACSISWNDAKLELEPKCEIDHKFEKFFEGRRYMSPVKYDDDDFKTQSMPSSPLRGRRSRSPCRRRRSITIPKPFKMTER